jgi:hypothetical protein
VREIVFVVLKVVIEMGIGGLAYMRVARFLRILNDEQLGPVNKLLARLHLFWI